MKLSVVPLWQMQGLLLHYSSCITTCSFDFDISGSSLSLSFFPISNYNLVSDCTPPKILQRRLLYLAEMSRSICSWRIFVFSITLVQLFWSCWASFVNKIRFSLIPSILASNLPTIFNLCCSSFTNRLTNVDDVFKGTFLSEDADGFVISPNSRTFYFPKLENFSFGNWKLFRNRGRLKA